MDKMNPMLPPELENALTGFYSAPEPTPAFAARLERELAMQQARLLQPGSAPKSRRDETMRREAKPERKSLMLTLRSRPLLAIVLMLLLALLLTGVAYAVGIRLGYIPGIGFVDAGNRLRVLAEPVSQTRDGVTVTVTKAILSTDRTAIVFKVEGLSSDKYSPLEPFNTCFASDELRLPNGKSVPITSGTSEDTSNILATGYESTLNHAGIPADVNDATLFIPCISGARAPGSLPENWEIPLRFMPAPPEMTVFPVVESTAPTATPEAEPGPVPAPVSGTSAAEQNPIAITKVLDIGESYILIIDFKLPPPSQATSSYWRNNLDWEFSDGNGQEVLPDPSIPVDGVELPVSDDPHEEFWDFKIAKGFAPPLHINWSYEYNFAADSVAPYTFEFDAGANPQPGQVWKVDKDFRWAGHAMHLNTISAIENGYRVSFGIEDASVFSYSVEIAGYTRLPPAGFGGGGGGDAPTEYSKELLYSEMPNGKLTVILSDLILVGDTKHWTLDWSPADSFPVDLPAPTATP